MALRQTSNPKHTTDRHETDYERWLKDHDDLYQPAGKPRYHPSDADNTNNNNEQDDYTKTNTKPKTKIPKSHSYAENTHVDDDGTVVQVSRYGSIMFPSEHQSGHESGASADNSMLRIGQTEPMICCGLSIVFVVVVLLGVGWGVKMHRRRQGQGRDKEGLSGEWKEDEKKDLMEEV